MSFNPDIEQRVGEVHQALIQASSVLERTFHLKDFKAVQLIDLPAGRELTDDLGIKLSLPSKETFNNFIGITQAWRLHPPNSEDFIDQARLTQALNTPDKIPNIPVLYIRTTPSLGWQLFVVTKIERYDVHLVEVTFENNEWRVRTLGEWGIRGSDKDRPNSWRSSTLDSYFENDTEGPRLVALTNTFYRGLELAKLSATLQNQAYMRLSSGLLRRGPFARKITTKTHGPQLQQVFYQRGGLV